MQFTLDTYLNPYLPVGTNRVDAIVTVGATGREEAVVRSNTVIGLIIDLSGSMQGERIQYAREATRKAIDLLDASAQFFVLGFSDHVRLISPPALATPQNKAVAQAAVQRLDAGGGTVMSQALRQARLEFARFPNAIPYALFLTDGKNTPNDEGTLEQELQACEGVFQCDCRGVGTDWQTKQLQKIAQKLLGTAQIIANPRGMEADFRAAIQGAMGRAIGDVRLRLWTPKSATILACKQMSPEIVDLTTRATRLDPQTFDFPTGAWGAESRDYQITIQVMQGDIGDEMLACRPAIVYQQGGQETKVAGKPVVATWTDDERLSSRINAQVAHYTGQEELASAIQEGLEARERGDMDTATRFLGRAAKLAAASGNEDTTRRLAKVVEIVDAHEGTVRLKSAVNKADEIDLDLGSTRTARAVRKPAQGA